MGKETQPIFFVSSGRSGTDMMKKMLNTYSNVEMHHEYLIHYLQPLSVRYYMGLTNLDEVCKTLKKLYGSAIYYSDYDIWGDSSNKLSWLIEGLNGVFPTAKFIHLVRDGRKVVSSFYHKLSDECYDDHSVAILQSYIDNPINIPQPPLEKKYWWPLPCSDATLQKKFQSFNQFQRICFYWGEVNRFIIDKLDGVPSNLIQTYKLEDIVSNRAILKNMLKFLNLHYTEDLFLMLQRPHNINIPRDYSLTGEQQTQLMEIAGDMMHHFGYDQTEEYRMNYHPEKVNQK